MKHFAKLPSLIQIAVADVLVVLMVSPLLASIAYWIFRPASAHAPPPMSLGIAVFNLIGLAILAWLLRGIFRPSIDRVSWVPVFNAGGAAVWNKGWSTESALPSTHPAYVFVDAFGAAFAGVIAALQFYNFDDLWIVAYAIIAMGALVPVLRLFAWYILGLRPDRRLPDERDRQQAARIAAAAWKPVVHLYGWFVVPAAILFVIFGYRENAASARAYQALTTLEAKDFAGANFLAPLRDLASQERRTRRIKLRLALKSPPQTCTAERNKNKFTYTGVVLSAGAAGDVFVAGVREQGQAIVKWAGGKKPGEIVEMQGRLGEMPAQLPDWKWYCGLDALSPRPKYFFDIEGYGSNLKP